MMITITTTQVALLLLVAASAVVCSSLSHDDALTSSSASLSLEAVDSCNVYSSCGVCTRQGACGWCQATRQCMTGSGGGCSATLYPNHTCATGQPTGQNPLWTWYNTGCPAFVRSNETGVAPADECTQAYSGCRSCLGNTACGWCGSADGSQGFCYEGSSVGPYANGNKCPNFTSIGGPLVPGYPLAWTQSTTRCPAITSPLQRFAGTFYTGNSVCSTTGSSVSGFGGVIGECELSNSAVTGATRRRVTCDANTGAWTLIYYASVTCNPSSILATLSGGGNVACGSYAQVNSTTTILSAKVNCLIQTSDPRVSDYCSSTYSSCSTCTTGIPCGWCASRGCISGTTTGPYASTTLDGTVGSLCGPVNASSTPYPWAYISSRCPIVPTQAPPPTTPRPPTPDPCTGTTDCEACVSLLPCGYCRATSKCMKGGYAGASNPNSTCAPASDGSVNEDWAYFSDQCPANLPNSTVPPADDECIATYNQCRSCTSSSSCGWCGTPDGRGTCYDGNGDGPNWNNRKCPNATVNGVSVKQSWKYSNFDCPAQVNASKYFVGTVVIGSLTCAADSTDDNTFPLGGLVGECEIDSLSSYMQTRRVTCDTTTGTWTLSFYSSSNCQGNPTVLFAAANNRACASTTYGEGTSPTTISAKVNCKAQNGGIEATVGDNCYARFGNDCRSCTSAADCGWCGGIGCLTGTAQYPWATTSPNGPGSLCMSVNASAPWAWTSGSCPVQPTADPCISFTTCNTCSAQGPCGWCEASRTCLKGGSLGSSPVNSSCFPPASGGSNPNWYYTTTSCLAIPSNTTGPDLCSDTYRSCRSCTGAAQCGWCGSADGSEGKCFTGGSSGPYSTRNVCPNSTSGAPQTWRWVTSACPAQVNASKTFVGIVHTGSNDCNRTDLADIINPMGGNVDECEISSGSITGAIARRVTCTGSQWTLSYYSVSTCIASSVMLSVSGSSMQSCGASTITTAPGVVTVVSASVNCLAQNGWPATSDFCYNSFSNCRACSSASQCGWCANVGCLTGSATKPWASNAVDGPGTLCGVGYPNKGWAWTSGNCPANATAIPTTQLPTTPVATTAAPTTTAPPSTTLPPIDNDPFARASVTITVRNSLTDDQRDRQLPAAVASVCGIVSSRVTVVRVTMPQSTTMRVQADTGNGVRITILPGPSTSVSVNAAMNKLLVTLAAFVPSIPTNATAPPAGNGTTTAPITLLYNILNALGFYPTDNKALKPSYTCNDGTIRTPCPADTVKTDDSSSSKFSAVNAGIIVIVIVVVLLAVVGFCCYRQRKQGSGCCGQLCERVGASKLDLNENDQHELGRIDGGRRRGSGEISRIGRPSISHAPHDMVDVDVENDTRGRDASEDSAGQGQGAVHGAGNNNGGRGGSAAAAVAAVKNRLASVAGSLKRNNDEHGEPAETS